MMPDSDTKQRRLNLEIQLFGKPVELKDGQLSEAEAWWMQHYNWFKDHGYILRPRYEPNWAPSWLGAKEGRWDFEDRIPAEFPSRLLDATRISDGAYVVFKRVPRSVHPFEVEIAQYFSSELLANEAGNRCVPVYDVLQDPEDEGTEIIVMPLLLEFGRFPFDTIGEAVECFRQLFEGLLFMHKHRVAHRDCTSRNCMVDPSPVYIDSVHPVDPTMKRDFSGPARFRTRTEGRPKHYLIDFGLSRRYDPSVTDPKEPPIRGADKTVPEFQRSSEPCDPFPTDVYYIGNMIRSDILESTRGLDFMRPLIADMVQDDPSKRPTMQEVMDRFEDIRAGLNTWKLRSRIVNTEENLFERITRGTSHWMRRIRFIAKGIPALPTPSS